VVLVEEGDVDSALDELWEGVTLLGIPWEGIARRGGHFVATYLANNEYGLCFVIPSAPYVDGELRRLIEDTLDPVELTHGPNRIRVKSARKTAFRAAGGSIWFRSGSASGAAEREGLGILQPTRAITHCLCYC
jgi:hypothetical protein